MGRGRAKAKQVKVARQLKYNSGGTDLDRLKEELGVPSSNHDPYEDSYDDLVDKYSDFADDDSGDDEDDEPRR
ncbi:DUF3073 domain-containing protein [Thermomonospora umbrina]|uniref:DUF3073 family protein n=1 Tax=Thermomonospora umbrina TaxID=111806 RepID=A0A3D9SSI6_9ACTN|nr:DUF3073 domain-containing protein [Thermomonospora umbrina]REE96943.1 DUF3073 family protein [Thermomonospora umbrina]